MNFNAMKGKTTEEKKAINYRRGNNVIHCSLCKHVRLLPPKIYLCDIISENVTPSYRCDNFEKKDRKKQTKEERLVKARKYKEQEKKRNKRIEIKKQELNNPANNPKCRCIKSISDAERSVVYHYRNRRGRTFIFKNVKNNLVFICSVKEFDKYFKEL